MSDRGFTLVEVLVALVVLEVGLLGVVGSMILAAEILTRAERIERAVGETERLFDSLSGIGGGTGTREVEGGVLRWAVGDDGWANVDFLVGDSTLVGLSGRIDPRP